MMSETLPKGDYVFSVMKEGASGGINNRHKTRTGYQKLDDGHDHDDISESKPRNKSVLFSPGRIFGKTKTHTSEVTVPVPVPVPVPVSVLKSKSVKKLAKTHPLFGFSNPKNNKKAMAKPEFLRYVEYLKEGGKWDTEANKAVMHFK